MMKNSMMKKELTGDLFAHAMEKIMLDRLSGMVPVKCGCVMPYVSMSIRKFTCNLALVLFMACLASSASAQQPSAETQNEVTKVNPDASGVIVIGPATPPPPVPVFFNADAVTQVTVSDQGMQQDVNLKIMVVQGEPKNVQLEIVGDGAIQSVSGEGILSYAVRTLEEKRFLELQVDQEQKAFDASIRIDSKPYELPATIDLTHLAAGSAIGFQNLVTVRIDENVVAQYPTIDGFLRVASAEQSASFQTRQGGKLSISLSNATNAPAPVEILDAKVSGEIADDQRSLALTWEADLLVNTVGSTIELVSGQVALLELPEQTDIRLQLIRRGEGYRYLATFLKPGKTHLKLEMIASVKDVAEDRRAVDLRVATGAVVPVDLQGFAPEVRFEGGDGLMVPREKEGQWNGYLPADGSIKMKWKVERASGEGKLFFATTAKVEALVGSGLLRQNHLMTYQVLQGELNQFDIEIMGGGEILDVQGRDIVSWDVKAEGGMRRVAVRLGKPMKGTAEFMVRTQTALGAFPLEVVGMSLVPEDAIRHSGYLRVSNVGSVTLEPVLLNGLTQLAPEQFPGDPIQSRQVFVYRFPSASYGFSVRADRVQPEVNLSELIQYELRETEKVILADIELDIREAAIREWRFLIPEDYSVVAVTGAGMTDYVLSSEIQANQRELKVLFGKEVIGRQLIQLQLEKSEIANAGSWDLPKIGHPDADSVRGDLGVVGTPGYRLSIEASELLVEKPLSYFPKPTANLQHAFRMRESDWSVVIQIEALQRSMQSDVFHLYSLTEENIYGSALINYFITGAPVSELKLRLPAHLKNEVVDGQDVQDARRSDDVLTVTLHQPVMGPYTLLVTFEEKPDQETGRFNPGLVEPIGVQAERGFIHIVSPMQVEMEVKEVSSGLLSLDPLELPNEFKLLSSDTAPTLGVWQYTERPFDLSLAVQWFQSGVMIEQVVEFAEVDTTISQDGEQVTTLVYYVKSRGQGPLRIKLPDAPARLWEVSVDGKPVTARETGDFTLIPLPSTSDPNLPVEVSLRLGKPAVDEAMPDLSLPVLSAPVLKTQWTIAGDDQRVISPAGGTVQLPQRILAMRGFEWVTRNGLGSLAMMFLLTGLAISVKRNQGMSRHLSFLFSALVIYFALSLADRANVFQESDPTLRVSLPILSAGAPVNIVLYNTPLWRANLSGAGLFLGLGGIVLAIGSLLRNYQDYRLRLRIVAVFLIMLGLLLQHGSASLFYWLIAIGVGLFVGLPSSLSLLSAVAAELKERSPKESDGEGVSFSEEDFSDASDESLMVEDTEGNSESDDQDGGPNGVVTSILLFMLATFGFGTSDLLGQETRAVRYSAADQIDQVWRVDAQLKRLECEVVMRITGRPGEQFLVLRAPAVLTDFSGDGVRLFKHYDGKTPPAYVISITDPETVAQSNANGKSRDAAVTENESTSSDAGSAPLATDAPESAQVVSIELKYSYQIESSDLISEVTVPTGDAAVNQLSVQLETMDVEIRCDQAVRTAVREESPSIREFVLAPGLAKVNFATRTRDLQREETKFFAETNNLYIPGPGVVDGVHRVDLRAAQGLIDRLGLEIPAGLTVSQVTGPVESWQFDPDKGTLDLTIAPAQSKPFSVEVRTQMGLPPLPTEVDLSPVRVLDADGEVGVIAVAFDGDAQPEKLSSQQLSPVNVGDFDATLLGESSATVYRVFRYGKQGGSITLGVTSVTPEVRVFSKQVLSLGDERVLLAVNLSAEISRTGVFKLSFPLPVGFEVESLSGESLHHWSEVTEDEVRKVVLHLNGKTLGTHSYALTFTSNTPSADSDWALPRLELDEAVRQTGELIVQPATGIRLSTVSRQNVSEVDPRSMGSATPGAVAYRLLQADWNLVLGIEKLESRISGDVLFEADLREGLTRSSIAGNFEIQNASIRKLLVKLPLNDPEEIKTLRALGATVSDFVPVDLEEQIWELQFKRRVLGGVSFKIEFERRGDRVDGRETLRLASFPEAGQVNNYYAVRAGGRLEIAVPDGTTGWKRVDWNAVPDSLRSVSIKTAPTLAMRIQKAAEPMVLEVQRHSLADALKLRVADGMLTSVLAPNGDQLTAVELGMEVIQRSSLTVGLPMGGEIFSIFVNGESVNSIRLADGDQDQTSRWQFYVLPGLDERTATVKFVYSVKGDGLGDLALRSPVLNVPLENIKWSIVAPDGYDLIDHDGNADLVRQARLSRYDSASYLRKSTMTRERKAQQAATTLQQANKLMQDGEQGKANMLFNSVANQYALDEASNEDARIQMENLQTKRAIVGLNSRRQRLFLDNDRDDVAMQGADQLRQAAETNPILQQGTLDFQLQEMSQLLRGNTSKDNAVLEGIAERLVQHQRTTEPAPQAIVISLPEEGAVYTFSRSVQVAENSPLELDLEFEAQLSLPFVNSLLTLILLLGSSVIVIWGMNQQKRA